MNREAAERVKKYINETRKMIGNDPEVLNMANGHKLLASDLLLLAGLASQAQQPAKPFIYISEDEFAWRSKSGDLNGTRALTCITPQHFGETHYRNFTVPLYLQSQAQQPSKVLTYICNGCGGVRGQNIKSPPAPEGEKPANKDVCPKCSKPWEDHEFSVPAPYCP